MTTTTPSLPRFTPRTLTFLRQLRRHNDRSWFAAHREAYESDVRAPMEALVERLAADFPRFAPELVASPRVSLYRIYRDTRFTDDKSPFKTQVAAVFPCRGLQRHQGASLYVEIGPAGVMIAGGIYKAEGPELRALRQHLAAHHARFRALVESPVFLRTAGPVSGDTLKRVPPGFPADHPAAEYLRLRQFLFGREYPAAFAATPGFYRRMLSLFERMAPVVRFLNEPLTAAAGRRDPLAADPRDAHTRARTTRR